MKKWEESFKIRTYDVDYNNKLKISSLLNYMQEGASNHANNLTFGSNDLNSKGLFWVLSRLAIEIYRLPGFNEELKVITWPKGTNKLFALRDFVIKDKEDIIVAKATTAWLVVDIETKKPKRLKDFEIFHSNTVEDNAINEIPKKIKDNENKTLSYSRTVNYSEIDINKHANNARYGEWIMDCFTKEEIESINIKSIQINFLSERKLGDHIEIYKCKQNDNSYYIEGSTCDTKVFQSVITNE